MTESIEIRNYSNEKGFPGCNANVGPFVWTYCLAEKKTELWFHTFFTLYYCVWNKTNKQTNKKYVASVSTCFLTAIIFGEWHLTLCQSANMLLLTSYFKPCVFKLCEMKGHRTGAAIGFIANDCIGITWKNRKKVINYGFVCIFPTVWGHLCVQESGFLWATAGEADAVSHDSPRVPAINDDNLNSDTLVFAEAARLDKLRKSPI